MTYITIPDSNEESLKTAAREFAAAAAPRLKCSRVIAFDAPMGAGKTTLIGALCRLLGTDDETNSPTFSIVNEYRLASPGPEAELMCGDAGSVYHIDAYRLDTPEEAMEAGLPEYLESEALCLVEWPGNIAALLPDDTLFVSIEPQSDGSRLVVFEE